MIICVHKSEKQKVLRDCNANEDSSFANPDLGIFTLFLHNFLDIQFIFFKYRPRNTYSFSHVLTL